MFPRQTGGDRRHWLYDPSAVHEIPQIQQKLVVHDDYESVPTQDKVVTFILDHLVRLLPREEADAISMTVIGGMTFRAAGRELGIDHKTVAARAQRGVARLREKISNTPWLADFLSGELFEDEQPGTILEAKQMFYSLFKEGRHE